MLRIIVVDEQSQAAEGERQDRKWIAMIKSEKLPNALYALQGVLIRAREIASISGDGLLDLLDYAEMLPRLIASEGDETDKFRDYLVEIAEQYKCTFVLDRFDDAVPLQW